MANTLPLRKINFTNLLRWILSIVIFCLVLNCSYLVFVKPDVEKLDMFNANAYPVGDWSQELEYIVYRYPADVPMEVILDSTTGQRYLRIQLNQHDGYKGFGIQNTVSINPNASVVIEWRNSGNNPNTQVDLKDLEPQSKQTSDVMKGEVFSTYATPPKDKWVTTVLPVSEFVRNQWQSKDNPKDGVLNTDAIQSIDFSLSPDVEATIDIRNVYFTKPSPKWGIVFCFVAVVLIGLFLWVRTTRENLVHFSNHQVFSNAVAKRIMYCLLSVALISVFTHIEDFTELYFAFWLISAFYAVLFFNSTGTGVFSIILSYRMLVLFALGWYLGFPQYPTALLLLLLVTAVPIIKNNSNIILYFITTGIVLFTPPVLYPYMSVDIETTIFVYIIFMIVLVAGRILYENVVTSLQAENTVTLYEELFENTSDAIFSFDDHGFLNTVNHGFAMLVGVNENQLIGRKIQEFVYPADLHILPFNITSITESLRKYDLRFEKQGGEILYTNVIERYKQEPDQRNIYQLIARDITQRIQVEQLEKEKSVAERANALKTQFLANMTHEIRTPLHGVLSALEILEKVRTEEEQKEFIGIAKTSGKMLLQLVNDVLDYSKIESGKLQLRLGIMILEQVVNDICNIMKNQVDQKQLKLLLSFPYLQDDRYFGDETRIRQVLLNLVGNAVKFTDQGEVVLSISVLEDTEEMTRFRFEVKDTGIGIAKENIATIFEVFSQEDSSYTRIHGGTGLGLAISKELVHLMDGEIGVESEKGVGSTFWFEIPITKEDAIPLIKMS